MKSKLKTFTILSLCLLSMWTVISCKKEKKAKGVDKDFYDMARDLNGFTWFRNSSSLLSRSSGSGHSQPFLKTRYNAIAATMLDSNARIMTGAKFPEGSLIVKELYENSSSLSRYAILYKNTGNANADAKGWVWGYVNSDGRVAEPASNKGSACIGCHSQTDNIDYMLMNKYFP